MARQPEEAVLEAVADRTQLTSALTESGEMLTQASFMVKNNGRQFQRFQLPAEAKFWGCYVDGQSSKAEKDNDWFLAPLPQRANRDEAFTVDIVYAPDHRRRDGGMVSQAGGRWKRRKRTCPTPLPSGSFIRRTIPTSPPLAGA